MKFYSALAFFLLCTMLVLSNPIRSTEETENKLIEKRANNFFQSLADTVNGVVNAIDKIGKAANNWQEEKKREECIKKKNEYYLDCLKTVKSELFICSPYQAIKLLKIKNKFNLSYLCKNNIYVQIDDIRLPKFLEILDEKVCIFNEGRRSN
ncbi:hypothetical protein BCR32DRAFT_279926 [Anaeromyces robustus]|uniref:Uncharacterized protein n=1 Tax=Anaeromyces robustus TaxID=1754192 RepID=A0A1Y1X751_9FUNG|nr:hypothetical protein BCR32DRAFT_279926 [Anaeromyces robustus]|eukprot:ORX81164.1 hypothetical protein BCR32DRAFT_279926 [Anaeromyces robustus]